MKQTHSKPKIDTNQRRWKEKARQSRSRWKPAAPFANVLVQTLLRVPEAFAIRTDGVPQPLCFSCLSRQPANSHRGRRHHGSSRSTPRRRHQGSGESTLRLLRMLACRRVSHLRRRPLRPRPTVVQGCVLRRPLPGGDNLVDSVGGGRIHALVASKASSQRASRRIGR